MKGNLDPQEGGEELSLGEPSTAPGRSDTWISTDEEPFFHIHTG